MTPINSKEIPTIIIAHRGPGNHLEKIFKDLKLMFEKIVVVGSERSCFFPVIKDCDGFWVHSESRQISELWEKGMNAQQSDRYILVQDTEYLSAVLKESIIEAIRKNQINSRFYPFKRQIFFLKQRFKYNLNWTHDPPSGLLFIQNHPVSLGNIFQSEKTKPLKAELIHF